MFCSAVLRVSSFEHFKTCTTPLCLNSWKHLNHKLRWYVHGACICMLTVFDFCAYLFFNPFARNRHLNLCSSRITKCVRFSLVVSTSFKSFTIQTNFIYFILNYIFFLSHNCTVVQTNIMSAITVSCRLFFRSPKIYSSSSSERLTVFSFLVKKFLNCNLNSENGDFQFFF